MFGVCLPKSSWIDTSTNFDYCLKTLPLTTSEKPKNPTMKSFIKTIGITAVAVVFLTSTSAFSQTDTKKDSKSTMTAAKKEERPSPPTTTEATVGDLKISIKYSQPGVKGRKVFGELVPFDKIWRTGANEATTVEVSRDCKVGGSFLRAGKYSLFTIPGATEWTIIFNTVPDQWGAYKYDESKDALRFKVKSQKAAAFAERLTFEIKADATGNGTVTLSWDNTSVSWEMR